MHVIARCTFALLAILAATSASALAQTTTGAITGRVTDTSGGVLAGVRITITSLRTGRVTERVTGVTGDFIAPLVPVGEYDVRFSLADFETHTVRNLGLSVSDRLTVDAELTLGGLSETVEAAAAHLIQATPVLRQIVDSRQVQELPLNNRNFVQLATLAPGVSSDLSDEVGIGLTSTVSLSINGARRNAINWLVDGVSNVDVGSNITLLSTPTLESIEEFTIVTNGYAAKWPRSGGGVVNVVTKSGSNEFAGSAYEFFRSDALNANSWVRQRSTDPQTRENPAALDYHNFGFTMGGPIARDRAFFFYSQEWRRITRAPASRTINVPNDEWLSEPASPNYVPPALRDSNALQLLDAFPKPNLPPLATGGPARFQLIAPNVNNTRQETVKVDYHASPRQRLWGRYTHDLGETLESQGLFQGRNTIPSVAGTDTRVPGQVLAVGVRTVVGTNRFNELTYQFSSNNIRSARADGVVNERSAFGLAIPELFPDNPSDLVPFVRITDIATIGAGQLFRIQYLNHTITDNFTWQRGSHTFKFGGLATFEQKNENAASAAQGTFSFVPTANGPTAFQSFMLGNAGGACAACSYTEAERDIDMQLRFNRFEFYAQDSWRVAPSVTLDYGVRYALYPPITDDSNLLVTFDPALYSADRAPQFANATGTLVDPRTGDMLVGIIQAGVNSPFGDAIYGFKKDAIQPRIGASWDPSNSGRAIVRSAFGIYYDQPLVGMFEENAFTTPPIVNNVTLTNPRLGDPAAGTSPTTTGVRTLRATATDFDHPRTVQWNAGVAYQLRRGLVADVAYVGTRGYNLIRPTDINYPQPADVVALQETVPTAVNPARPYRSYGSIIMRETTGRSRYHGLQTSLRFDGGRDGGTLSVNYTLSRNRTDATNDRDGIDIPQNPLDPEADYADARTDRRHVLTAFYVYELPFFREGRALAKALLNGWQVAGIVAISSGQPVPRVSVSTNNFRRGGFADLVGDIREGYREVDGVPYWFNPAAFAPPADGTFGNSGRAPFRQPGHHNWDISLSKSFHPTPRVRLQFRADFINAFNQRQWLADPLARGMDNTCMTNVTTCGAANDTFGQLLNTHAPREVQLGLRVTF